MNFRTELANLITNGAQRPEIYDHFASLDYLPSEVDHLLYELGIHLPEKRREQDGISDSRRAYLQELSTLDD